MGYHLQILKMSLESIDKVNFFESKGFDMDLTSESDMEKIKENQKLIIEKLMQVWTLEKVERESCL